MDIKSLLTNRGEPVITLQGQVNDRILFDISEDGRYCVIASLEKYCGYPLYPESNLLLLYDFPARKRIAVRELGEYGYKIEMVRFQHGRIYTGARKPKLDALRAWDLPTLEPLYYTLQEFYHRNTDAGSSAKYKGRMPRMTSFDGKWKLIGGILFDVESGKAATDCRKEDVMALDSRGRYMIRRTKTDDLIYESEIKMVDLRSFRRTGSELDETDRICREYLEEKEAQETEKEGIECIISVEETPASIGGEQHFRLSGGSQSPTEIKPPADRPKGLGFAVASWPVEEHFVLGHAAARTPRRS